MTDGDERVLERRAKAGDPEAVERVRVRAFREAVRLHCARLDVPCTEGGLRHRFPERLRVQMSRRQMYCRLCRSLIQSPWSYRWGGWGVPGGFKRHVLVSRHLRNRGEFPLPASITSTWIGP